MKTANGGTGPANLTAGREPEILRQESRSARGQSRPMSMSLKADEY